MEDRKIKEVVKKAYGQVARQKSSCCPGASCCGTSERRQDISAGMGYSERDIQSVPEGVDMGLGCGNPIALASLREGERVLDLGAGGGFDCFLAANKVGANGRIIGVDMTPEMVEKARENARRGGYKNVEFRIGEIESLPVEDESVDVVISNCVINLVPDKKKAFSEAFRVLKPGGRIMISDIVLLQELPERIKQSLELYVGCLSGAALRDEYLLAVKKAGFEKVKVVDETVFPAESLTAGPAAAAIIADLRLSTGQIEKIAASVRSIKVSGTKPQRGRT
jgi:arsenite methyltransferase